MSTYESSQSVTETVPRFVSWLAAIGFVFFALATYTMSVGGSPLRRNVATVGHLALALFAIPQVREPLATRVGVDIDRWMVAAVLVAGVIVVEGVISPPIDGTMLP
ncbi:MAG: hypothetical protein ABEJ42_04150 [Halobacteriaceae archaeon]